MASKPEYPALSPCQYDDIDIMAVKAVAAGIANDVQQKRAVDWIISRASAYYDLSFQVGNDGDRVTAFAEGRRFVGAQIVKLMKMPASR